MLATSWLPWSVVFTLVNPYSRSLLGASEPARSLFGACSDPTRSLLGSYSEPVRSLFGACSDPTRSMFGACSDPTRSLLGACWEPSCGVPVSVFLEWSAPWCGVECSAGWYRAGALPGFSQGGGANKYFHIHLVACMVRKINLMLAFYHAEGFLGPPT